MSRPRKIDAAQQAAAQTLEVKKFKDSPHKNYSEQIKSQFVLIPEHAVVGDQKTKKYGRYAASIYPDIPDYGTKRFVILAYLYTDFAKHRETLEEDQIVKGSINYLVNLKDKKERSKFGNLELYKYNIIIKNGIEVAVCEMITTDKKNDHFWGIGFVEY